MVTSKGALFSQGLCRQVHRKRKCGPQRCSRADAFAALDLKGIEGSDPSWLAVTTCRFANVLYSQGPNLIMTGSGVSGASVTALESRAGRLRARQCVQEMIDLALFDGKLKLTLCQTWEEYRKNRHRSGLLSGIEIFSSRQITRSK